MSIKQEKFEEFTRQFSKLLPEDLRQYKKDMDKNMRAAFQSVCSRMDLVTREEFDVQAKLLSRTRELVQELEGKLKELEEKLNQQKQ